MRPQSEYELFFLLLSISGHHILIMEYAHIIISNGKEQNPREETHRI